MSHISEAFRELVAAHRTRARRATVPARKYAFFRIADSFARLADEAERQEQSEELDSAALGASRAKLDALAARLEVRLSLAERIEAILDAAIALLGADFGNVQILDMPRGTLKIVAQRNFGNPFLAAFAAVDPRDASVCGHALRAGSAVVVEDVREEPTLDRYRTVFDEAGVRAVQSTPIVAASGAIVGMLSTHFARPYRPSRLEMAAAEICAGYVSEALAALPVQPASSALGRVAT